MNINADILDIDDLSDGSIAPDVDLIDSFSKPLDFLPSESFLTAESHLINYTHHTRFKYSLEDYPTITRSPLNFLLKASLFFKRRIKKALHLGFFNILRLKY